MSIYTDTYEDLIELLNDLLGMPEFNERSEEIIRLRNRLKNILGDCY
jgi:hypothetical protein